MSSGARTGAVTLIQRFGSAPNLNVHLHMLFLDGAYRLSNNRLTFHRARRPTCEELDSLLVTLSRRIVRALERRGLLIADPEHCCLDLGPDSSLDHLQAASINYRIARLAALVPRPGLNLTRFHGVFAPNFKHRERIVPQ